VQVARDAGAFVIGTASTARKRDYASSLGCDATLDPADDKFVDRGISRAGVAASTLSSTVTVGNSSTRPWRLSDATADSASWDP